ncbi:MAG: hypothetical protein AB1898_09960 [Acidobacteriota bacterium]
MLSTTGKRCLVLISAAFLSVPICAFSQVLCYPTNRALDLLAVQAMVTQYESFRSSCQQLKAKERRNVPTYNARLNGAVVSFHGHIIKDNHHLTTNCSVCRKYLREIRSYAKKIEQAMK